MRRWFLTKLRGIATPSEASAGGAKSDLTPITEVNKGIREVESLLRQATTKFQEIEKECKNLRFHSGQAWQEKQELYSDYYKVIGDILDIIDDCENGPKGLTQTSGTYEKLKMILQEQNIEAIAVRKGDKFDAVQQDCLAKVETGEEPPGCVAEVIMKGYIQRRKNSAVVVIRPAKVKVSVNVKDSEEGKNER